MWRTSLFVLAIPGSSARDTPSFFFLLLFRTPFQDELTCPLPAAYRAVRFDGKAQTERTSSGIEVPALLRVEKLEIPFIDLFAPHFSLEEPGYCEL